MDLWCPLCSNASTFLSPWGKTSIHHCEHCDLIFKHPSMWPTAEEERRRYLLHMNSISDEGYVRMLDDFLSKAVVPYCEPSSRLLDFGSGPTPVLKALLEQEGYTVDIYDPFFAPLQPSAQYAGVTCTEVVEHVHTPRVMWGHMCSLLEPQGVLAIMTQFHPGELHVRDWWYLRDTTHVVFYSECTLRWVADTFGMTIAYTDHHKIIVYRRN